MEKLREFVFSLILKIKIRAKYISAAAILVTAAFYILNPGGKPYIHVPSSEVLFHAPPFKECEIFFLSPVFVQSHETFIEANVGRSSPRRELMTSPQSSPTSVNREVSSLRINPPNTPVPAGNYHVVVRVTTSASLSVEVSAVKLDGRGLDLKRFYAENLESAGGAYHRLRYFRKDLARFVFHLNDVVSNWVLTIMAVGIIALLIEVVCLEVIGRFSSPASFKKRLLKHLGTDSDTSNRSALMDRHNAEWAARSVRFSYYQIVGPSIGFLFTISSLVAALHPRLRLATDLDAFMSGLHIAMLSTFLGLIIRIIALEGSRINDVIVQRADLILNTPETSGGVPAQKVESLANID